MKEISINRNIVECKVGLFDIRSTQIQRINRNIVECKVNDVAEAMATVNRINRNIVECKEKIFEKYDYIQIEVLIETLWNVKDGFDEELPFN